MKSLKYFVAEKDAIEYPEGLLGRQVCTETAAGKREYKARTTEMWDRQGGICPMCGHWIELRFAQMEHQDGRGFDGSIRDDRTIVDGEWHNAAVHGLCNTDKGSKRYHWLNGKYVPVSREVKHREVA